MCETHPQIEYRWCRTVDTKSNEVKLVTTFSKYPVTLKWDNRRVLYLSESFPTPCGRHDAQLLIDGSLYPCDTFTVASSMFEVNVFTKDTSSDEERAFTPLQSIRKYNSQTRLGLDSKLEPDWSPSPIPKVNLGTSCPSLYFSDEDFTPKSAKRLNFDLETEEKMATKRFVNGLNVDSCKRESTSPTPTRDGTEGQPKSDDGQPRNVNIELPGMNSVWCQQPIHHQNVIERYETIRETSSINLPDPLAPQSYVKTSVDVEEKTNEIFKSFEKSVSIMSNSTELCKGSERLVEIGLSGRETNTHVVSVNLRDNEAQTTMSGPDAGSTTAAPLQKSDSASQTHDHSREDLSSEDGLVGDRTIKGGSVGDRSLDNGSSSKVANKDKGELAESEGVVADGKANKAGDISQDVFDTCLVFQLPMPIRKPGVVITEVTENLPGLAGLADEEDASLLLHTDEALGSESSGIQEHAQDSSLEPDSVWEDACEEARKVEQKSDNQAEIEMTGKTGMGNEEPLLKIEVVTSPSPINKDDMKEVKEHVCRKEHQIRRLQHEISLLEDSHRYLYRENLNRSRNDDYYQQEALKEDSHNLKKEVEVLRSQVDEQHRINDTLKWEVKTLRERLDANDPGEVVQLIGEMRILRDELAGLSGKNKELYEEIVNLRIENTNLKKLQNIRNDRQQRRLSLQMPRGETLPNSTTRSDSTMHSNIRFESVDDTLPSLYYSMHSFGKSEEDCEKEDQFGPLQSPPRNKLISSAAPDLVVSSNSESDGTQYNELPLSLSQEKLAALSSEKHVVNDREERRNLNGSSSPVASVTTQTVSFAAEEMVESPDGSKRSFGVQTAVTAVEDESSAGTDNRKHRQHHRIDYGRNLSRSRTPPHHRSYRTSFSRMSSESGSSTDSLLEEADNMIRESMHELLDGVKDRSERVTCTPGSKRSGKHLTKSVFTTSTASFPSDGSGDQVRSVSYHDSFDSTPFTPRDLHDLREGYTVRFMHPFGGMGVGCVRYVGRLPGEVGTFVGVELSEPRGTGNGDYGDFQYFKCEANQGIFIPFRKVVIAWKS